MNPIFELNKHFRVPSQPVNPPLADEATIERNIANSIRGDCVNLLNSLEDRLDELGRLFPDSFRELREELKGEMEE